MSAAGLRHRRRIGEDSEKPAKSSAIPLESFDLYQKVRDSSDTIATNTGGTVTIIAIVVCLLLTASEVYGFLVPTTREHIVVDSVLEDRLTININVSFPALACPYVSLDALDVAGEQQNGLDHDIHKERLDKSGQVIGEKMQIEELSSAAASPLPENYCGSCYGAEKTITDENNEPKPSCCNSCDDVRKAYSDKGWDVSSVTLTAEQCKREGRSRGEKGEGCRVSGFLRVNRVTGNFHIAMGETHARGAGHVHQFNPQHMHEYNVSHIIHNLSFGQAFPGIKNPLDGTSRIVTEGVGAFMYYIKIIPTVYNADGSEYKPSRNAQQAETPKGLIRTNQYSASTEFKQAVVFGNRINALPGVFFVYDISPFMVNVSRHTTTLPQLLTSIFAILGGVLSLAGIIDAMIFYAVKAMKVSSKEGLTGLIGKGNPLITPPAAVISGIRGYESPQAAWSNTAPVPSLQQPMPATQQQGSTYMAPAAGHMPLQQQQQAPPAAGYMGGNTLQAMFSNVLAPQPRADKDA